MTIEVMARADLPAALQRGLEALTREHPAVGVAWLRTLDDLAAARETPDPERCQVAVLCAGDAALHEAAGAWARAGGARHWVWLAPGADSPAVPPWLLALGAHGEAGPEVFEPADDRELRARLADLAESSKPMHVLVRSASVLRTPVRPEGAAGAPWSVLLDGTDATVICSGGQVGETLAAAMELQTQAIRVRVAAVSRIAPLPQALHAQVAPSSEPLFVAEPAGPEDALLLAALRRAGQGLERLQPVARRAPHDAEEDAELDAYGPVRGPTARDIQVAVLAAVRAARGGARSTGGSGHG